MKITILLIMSLSLFSKTNNIPDSIYEFKIKALNSDQQIEFSEFKGKKILLVNVASKCGFTKQYEGLQELYTKYQDQLVIIGLPCNQFLMQEPGSEEKIAQFCSLNYGVVFPITTKIKVKGSDQHPIYAWLTSKKYNGLEDYKVSWNFNKFLVSETGELLEYFPSKVTPMDESITSYFN